MSISLTEKEQDAVWRRYEDCDKGQLWDNVLIKAQLKKVYEWGNEDCPHAGSVAGETLLHKHDCYKCWEALLNDVE